MKYYHNLSWKELKAQKVTSFLIVIAIILSTIMTTVIGQSLGILQALRMQQAGNLNGYRYVTFHNITTEQKNLLTMNQQVSWAGSTISLGTAKLQNSGIQLQLKEYDQEALSAYPSITQVVKGKLPESSNEIALSQDALKLGGFSQTIGDSIYLDLSISTLQDLEQSHRYTAEFKLSGILVNNYLGYSSGVVAGVAGSGSASKHLPSKYLLHSTDIITGNKKDFQKIIHDLSNQINSDANQIQYNWVYLNALNIKYDNPESVSESKGFSFMTVSGILIGFLVLLAAGLVIYNILKIAVTKRIFTYGALRAIGSEKKQLYIIVSKQLIILCGIGIPIGLILGVLSASGITKMAASFFSPEIFMVQNVEELTKLISQNSTGKILPLIVSVLITLVFSFFAAIPVARYASEVSPTVAMSCTSYKIKRKNRKEKKIRNFELFYALLNLKRNTSRTFFTILSLVMSITVFIALNAFSNMLDSSKEVQKLQLGDYALTSETNAITPSVINELLQDQDISMMYTLKYKEYLQKDDGTLSIATDIKLKQLYETLQIIGIDSNRLRKIYPKINEEQIRSFENGEICLIKNPVSLNIDGNTLEATSFYEGDKITVSGYSLTVAGNCESISLVGTGYTNGVQIVVADSVCDKLTNSTGYTELYPKLSENADREEFDKLLERICDSIPDGRFISFENVNQQLEESYQQIKLLAWGLILFIGIIALLNIINTSYTNIYTRMREIGIQRAIGMSTSTLYKIFLWEGIYYGVIASIIGAIIGYICTILVESAIAEQFTMASFPIMITLQAAIISIISCLVATCVPLFKVSKINIVASIETTG